MNKLMLASVSAIVGCLLGGCALLQDEDLSTNSTTDAGIAAAATSRLDSDTMTARATLNVEVVNGAATLYGVVPDTATRSRAMQILDHTPGVTSTLDRTRLR